MGAFLVLAPGSLGLAGGTASAAPPRVAQAAPVGSADANRADRLAAATDAAVAQLRQAQRRRRAAQSQKAEVAKRYESQLAEIDQLKKRRASWRRDRLIRNRLSESLGTANTLAALDKRIRSLDARLRARHRAVVVAVDAELTGARPSAARQRSLLAAKRASQRGLRRGAKKIVLPDDRIDPLADPEELEYQASLLEQSEAQLERELDSLARQARRFERMGALRAKRARAAELGRFDDNGTRRAPGRVNNRNGGASQDDVDAEPAGQPAPPADPSGPDEGFEEPNMFDGDPVVVLADVVDAGTIDALRAADRSSNPTVKAKAAKRARDQVRARLERLRQRRVLMQNRAKKLRRGARDR